MKAVVASVLVLCAGLSAQQPRDNRPRLAAGSGAVLGLVVQDGPDRMPLRRVRVTINGVEIEFARTVVTGDDGRFVFEGLPAGRYVLVAAKEGYVTTSAGARRLGRLGSLELTSGGRANVDLMMVKGAVITGRVQMAGGEPAQGIAISVLKHEISRPFGERRLVQAAPVSIETDDRGEYRVFGLAPGTYYIRAQPRFQMVPAAEEGLHLPTEAEIRAAMAEVKAEATSSRPGIPTRPRPAAVSRADTRRGVTLAPIYFPSTPIPSRAAALTVKPAEVRTGVDIDLEYVPLSTVEGFVNVPPGTSRVVLTLSSTERVAGGFSRSTSGAQDGAFMFRGVPPGSYTITARVLPVLSSGAGPGATYWGTTDITVSGDDLSGISVGMQPGLTIEGRVVFDASSGFASELGAMTLPQIQAANVTFATNALLPPVRFDGQSFRIEGVVPGTYRFLTPPRGVRAPLGRWWLKSFVLNGREMLDEELDLRESSDAAVVTFSDRASELTGTVLYASGLPVRDEMIVVFPANPRHWFYGSRRIAAVRTSEAGRYIVRNLPPGDYFIAATSELTQGEWYDPAELRELSPEATVVRIAADERVVNDVRLTR